MSSRFHPPAKLTVAETLEATKGRLIGGATEGEWTFCTDSRAMSEGAVFVALRGETFDGHRFVEQVTADWSSGALVEEVPAEIPTGAGPIILVSDTLVALGDVARAVLLKSNPPVAAVTGSVGKTTTRAMLASILSQSQPGLSTEGNFNNRIGVPLTLLGLRPEDPWVVLEMGMSEPGEIRALASIAEPAVRVITTVSAGHLEFFDSVDEIADAKGELFESAGPGDTLVMQAGAWFSDRFPKPEGARVVTFSTDALVRADVQLLDWTDLGLAGSEARISVGGSQLDVELPLAGFHQVHNALAAAAAAYALGADLSDIGLGLARVELPGRRMRIETVGDVTVVDDSYNANPASVLAALETLQRAGASGRRVAALGDMLELGTEEVRLHKEIGERASELKLDLLVGAGSLMANAVEVARLGGVHAYSTPDSEAAGRLLHTLLEPGDVLLLKGSRGMRMERVLDSLRSVPEGNQ